MRSLDEKAPNRIFHHLTKYFGVLMTVVYLALGLAMLLRAKELFNFPESYSLPLGSVLFAYGLFRGYKVYEKHFRT